MCSGTNGTNKLKNIELTLAAAVSYVQVEIWGDPSVKCQSLAASHAP